MNNYVVKPDYYKDEGLTCQDAIKAILNDYEGTRYEGFLVGSIIKYLWRYPKKGGETDLMKAFTYLDDLIEYKLEQAL